MPRTIQESTESTVSAPEPINKGGRPKNERPSVRAGLSMRAQDADLISTVIDHARKHGTIKEPAPSHSKLPFAGVLPLLRTFCEAYVEKHSLEIVKYDPK